MSVRSLSLNDLGSRCRTDMPGAIDCTSTRGVASRTSGTARVLKSRAASRPSSMLRASPVKSSSGSMASKIEPSIASTSMTSLKRGAARATMREARRSRAMSARTASRISGRWIFTTAGPPPGRVTL